MSISKIIFIINNSLTTKLKVIFILTSLVFFILTLKANKTKESFSYSHKKFMIFIGCWLALLAIIILINMWSTGFFISGVASRSVGTISVPYYAWWAGVLLVHTIIYFIYRRVYVTKRSKQDKQSKHINS
ncbi:hypothetical protein [Ureaplasma diversum]|uniref:hypothetical protein n=2 Tax=Ureaplasma diversum TaxID=42094 RepID=UPI001C9D4E56|nr:hypothetical protein [Ureaplasma diversum]